MCLARYVAVTSAKKPHTFRLVFSCISLFLVVARSFVFVFLHLPFPLPILAIICFLLACTYKWLNTLILRVILSCFSSAPPPNQPPMKSLERSNFPAPKSQELVKFRKEIEQNNVQKVYELINLNPRYLVSSGDTPSILKEGPRYNALHVAAINKHAKMAKLILQTVEQPEFIEHLHGFKNDPMVHEMSQFLLESYLNTPDKSRNDTPLHFAAKVGAVDVIEVLISYPLCKKKPNSEGKYPEDVSGLTHIISPTEFIDFILDNL